MSLAAGGTHALYSSTRYPIFLSGLERMSTRLAQAKGYFSVRNICRALIESDRRHERIQDRVDRSYVEPDYRLRSDLSGV